MDGMRDDNVIAQNLSHEVFGVITKVWNSARHVQAPTHDVHHANRRCERRH